MGSKDREAAEIEEKIKKVNEALDMEIKQEEDKLLQELIDEKSNLEDLIDEIEELEDDIAEDVAELNDEDADISFMVQTKEVPGAKILFSEKNQLPEEEFELAEAYF